MRECQIELVGCIRMVCGAVTTSVCMQPITKMNPQSDMFVDDDMGGGEQMDHYWLPGGQFYNPTCPEGLMAA